MGLHSFCSGYRVVQGDFGAWRLRGTVEAKTTTSILP